LPSFLHTNVKAKGKNPVCETSFNKFKNVLKIMKRNLSVEDQKQECKELENLKRKIYKPTIENKKLKKKIYEQKDLRVIRNYMHEKMENIRVFCRVRPIIHTEQTKA